MSSLVQCMSIVAFSIHSESCWSKSCHKPSMSESTFAFIVSAHLTDALYRTQVASWSESERAVQRDNSVYNLDVHKVPPPSRVVMDRQSRVAQTWLGHRSLGSFRHLEIRPWRFGLVIIPGYDQKPRCWIFIIRRKGQKSSRRNTIRLRQICRILLGSKMGW